MQAARQQLLAQASSVPALPDVDTSFARNYVPGRVVNDTAQLSKKARKKARQEERRAKQHMCVHITLRCFIVLSAPVLLCKRRALHCQLKHCIVRHGPVMLAPTWTCTLLYQIPVFLHVCQDAAYAQLVVAPCPHSRHTRTCIDDVVIPCLQASAAAKHGADSVGTCSTKSAISTSTACTSTANWALWRI